MPAKAGTIHGGAKGFAIDHPVDPGGKFLYHLAVESSEMLNSYSGNVIHAALYDAPEKAGLEYDQHLRIRESIKKQLNHDTRPLHHEQ